jgi:hypothetical protein
LTTTPAGLVARTVMLLGQVMLSAVAGEYGWSWTVAGPATEGTHVMPPSTLSSV